MGVTKLCSEISCLRPFDGDYRHFGAPFFQIVIYCTAVWDSGRVVLKQSISAAYHFRRLRPTHAIVWVWYAGMPLRYPTLLFKPSIPGQAQRSRERSAI
jgi:hypothetical protein